MRIEPISSNIGTVAYISPLQSPDVSYEKRIQKRLEAEALREQERIRTLRQRYIEKTNLLAEQMTKKNIGVYDPSGTIHKPYTTGLYIDVAG